MAEDGPRDGVLAPFPDHRATTPLRVCEVSAALLPVTGAAIVLMSEANRPEIVCATDDVSERLETLGFTLGEGPCLQAACTGSPVLVSDIRDVGLTPWPIFAEAASRTPARALYSFPLRIGATSVGVLDLYRDRPGLLTAAQRVVALVFAEVAVRVMLSSPTGADADVAFGWSAPR